MSPIKQKNLISLFMLLACFSVFASIIGGMLCYTPVPLSDMWGSIVFLENISLGYWGSWWMQHNEHRIILSRLLFWIDEIIDNGSGIFLIHINYLLLLASFYFLNQCLHERLRHCDSQFPRKIIALLILTASFSWLQQENMTWTFQSQFLLSYLLPLIAFYYLHRAHQSLTTSRQYFYLATFFGFIAIGSMANGVLVLPLLAIMATLLRMGWQRIGSLCSLSMLSIALYFYNYQAPAQHSSLSDSLLHHPIEFIQYLLLYLGAPFYFLYGWGASYLAAQLMGVLLIASAGYFAWKAFNSAERDSLTLALLFFMLYVGGAAFGLTGGRLIFGLSQALSWRYMTPTLQAWSVLLILLSPWLAQQLSTSKSYCWAILLGLEVLFVIQQMPAFKNQDQRLHQYLVAALAVEMEIQDEQAIHLIFPHVPYLLNKKNHLQHKWSIFKHPLLNQAKTELGQIAAISATETCLGGLESYTSLTKDPRFVRVSGWLTDQQKSIGSQRIQVLNQQREIIGYAITGAPREDLKARLSTHTPYVGFYGYLSTAYVGQEIILKGVASKCELTTSLKQSKLLLDN